MFNIGDIVFVSKNDDKYEEENGIRYHKNFFGKVLDVTEFPEETVIEVDFCNNEVWSYDAEELSLAKEIRNMTLEDFSNKYDVIITAQYI